MATLQVQDQYKIGKEQLLLGDKEVTIKDCQGNEVQIHGLMGNDLLIKLLDGTVVPLWNFIVSAGATRIDVTNGTVTDQNNDTVQLVDVVNQLEDLQFEIADLEQKYSNL